MQVSCARRSRGRGVAAPSRPAGRLPVVPQLSIAAAVAIAALALAGCSHSAGQGSSDAGKQCGMSRSAANVPVSVMIDHGYASCSTALAIEKDYARAIDEGKAPGNGGGGPVPVLGWVCEGFATPQVLKTGDASECTKGHNEILAMLSA